MQSFEKLSAPPADKPNQEPEVEPWEPQFTPLTELDSIAQKLSAGEGLLRSDLLALYEVDREFEPLEPGRNDPRIEDLRSQRNALADAATIFKCPTGDIAQNLRDVSLTTRAFIGPVTPDVLEVCHALGIDHLYASFPGERVEPHLIIENPGNVNTAGVVERESLPKPADFLTMLGVPPDRNGFIRDTVPNSVLDLAALTVSRLGIEGEPDLETVTQCVATSGLDLSVDEWAPDDPRTEEERRQQGSDGWCYVTMNQINNMNGTPYTFRVRPSGEGSYAIEHGTRNPDIFWHLDTGRTDARRRYAGLKTTLELARERMNVPQIIRANG